MFQPADILLLLIIFLVILLIYSIVKKYYKKKTIVLHQKDEAIKTVNYFVDLLYDNKINEYSLEMFKKEFLVQSGKNIEEKYKDEYYNECFSSLIAHPDIDINHEKSLITKKYLIRPYKIHETV